MSTTLFEDLIDEVQLYTESAPLATISQFVKRACVTLCRESRVWRIKDTETLVPGEDDLNITNWVNPPGETAKQLIAIEEIRFDGKPLGHKTEKQLSETPTRYGTVLKYYQPTLHDITLLNVPDTFTTGDVDYIEYTISVAPSNTATGMDTDILDRYRDGIVSGAVGMLFAMPRKTWSSPQFSSQYMGEFAGTVARAQLDANQEFSRRIARTVKYGGI